MAIAKVIFNGETLIDVTQKTVKASTAISGVTALDWAGEDVVGNIGTKSSADLTASGSTVTVPAGYYATQATKSISAGSAFPPAVTITKNPTMSFNNSTGVITATYSGSSYITPTVNPGYISSGTSGIVSTYGTSTYSLTVLSAADLYQSNTLVYTPQGYYSTSAWIAIPTENHADPTIMFVSDTGNIKASHTINSAYVLQIGQRTTSSTLALTTQAAQTLYPSTVDQTIASYRWLTGTQTIKSVTTSNITAANIASGVVVKIGDSANASRILQVTGTFQGGITPTGTYAITSNGSYDVTNYASAVVSLPDGNNTYY